MVERKATVRGTARARARERATAAMQARRERESKIEALVVAHGEAVELAEAEREAAERRVAAHMTVADKAIADLLELGETAGSIAELLELPVGQVRAALRRSRGGTADADDVEGGSAQADDASAVDGVIDDAGSAGGAGLSAVGSSASVPVGVVDGSAVKPEVVPV